MAEKLTKQLLQEKREAYKKTIEVEAFEDTFEIEIKPMTGPQTADVDAEAQEGITMKGDIQSGEEGAETGGQSMAINVKENQRGSKTSDIKACAYGTVDENFSKNFIEKNWPNSLISQVAKEVKKLSKTNTSTETRDTIEQDNVKQIEE